MMKQSLLVLFTLVTVLSAQVQAAEDTQGFKGESEFGNTVTSGNTSTNNLAAKTENKYLLGQDLWTATGRYLRNTDKNVETALFWDAGLRYDRVITEHFSVFLGHKAEADPYAGYVQRDSTDLGGKYYFFKSDEFYWLAEAGYRYSKTHVLGGDTYASFARLYTEAKQNFDKTSYGKLWVEYLPNLTNSNAYLVNAEASVSAVLTSLLSLKVSYLVKYQNEPLPTFERTDSIFITTLVAKY